MPANPGMEVLLDGPAAERALAEQQLAGRLRRKPPMLPPYRPFPEAALPDPIRTFVVEAAKALGCDEALPGLPALAGAAGLIGNTRAIALRRGWREPYSRRQLR